MDHDTERKEIVDRLWAALLAHIETIKEGTDLRNASRGTAMVSGWTGHTNHLTVSVKASFSHMPDDGSTENYLVTARQRTYAEVEFSTDQWTSYHESYWEDQIARPDNAFVAAGIHYRIGKPRTDGMHHLSGFSGARATVTFHDSRVIESRNIWKQGPVPAPFRDRLPDNAVLNWNYGYLTKEEN
jgi:hypothetical protein